MLKKQKGYEGPIDEHLNNWIKEGEQIKFVKFSIIKTSINNSWSTASKIKKELVQL